MESKLSGKVLILGLQHLIAMFGATVLVPILTGLSPSVALLGAGIGTLIFHFITKKKIPVFLGSSFAFISIIQHIGQSYGLPYACGGIVIAGIMYVVYATIVKLVGVDKIQKLFPEVITGTMIIVIGLTLAPSTIDSNIVSASVGTLGERWFIATITVAMVIFISMFAKGFIKLLPILFGIGMGYIVSLIFGFVDTNAIINANWVQIPSLMLPKFNLESVLLIAPLSLVTLMEHIGDITTIGSVVGEDYMNEVGLHKTLLGDGIATIFAGLIGAPANTTYSENTGVLAITKAYNPFILRVTAIMAILLSFVGKLGIILQTIPSPVMGGISIILFGMIASTGIRTLVDAKVDFGNSRNSIIVAVMLVMGLSGVILPIGNVGLTGMSLSALVGVVLNGVLPEKKDVE